MLLKIPLHLIYLISYCIPRNDKKWVFSAWEGKAYRGNARYYFEYITKDSDINSIWITKNQSVHESLKDKVNIQYAYSIQGIYSLLTARVVICSHGLYDVIPYVTGGSFLVSLGHVTYPIKKMSFVEKFSSMSVSLRLKTFLHTPYDHIKPAYEIVTSDNTKKSTMFLSDKKPEESRRIIPLGLPKTDYLIGIASECRKILFKNILNKAFPEISNQDKIILFLPTWRNDKSFSVLNFGYNMDKINRALSDNSAHMFINFHPFDESLRSSKVERLGRRVHAISYGGDTITQLLCATDIFITDYSSLYSDFLIYDRPIIFAKFAHNEYVEERELQVDYDSLPGKSVTNWDEISSVINMQLREDCNQYKNDRELWRKLVYSGTDDGKSCERITTFIKSSI